jgi:hypothetical protein
VVTAARDLGLRPEHLEPLALRICPDPASVDALAVAVADAILDRNS